MLILILLLLSGCSEVDVSNLSDEDLERISDKAVVCNEPYIRVGVECCLDEDQNNICDRDETLSDINSEGDEGGLEATVEYKDSEESESGLEATVEYKDAQEVEVTVEDDLVIVEDNSVTDDILIDSEEIENDVIVEDGSVTDDMLIGDNSNETIVLEDGTTITTRPRDEHILDVDYLEVDGTVYVKNNDLSNVNIDTIKISKDGDEICVGDNLVANANGVTPIKLSNCNLLEGAVYEINVINELGLFSFNLISH